MFENTLMEAPTKTHKIIKYITSFLILLILPFLLIYNLRDRGSSIFENDDLKIEYKYNRSTTGFQDNPARKEFKIINKQTFKSKSYGFEDIVGFIDTEITIDSFYETPNGELIDVLRINGGGSITVNLSTLEKIKDEYNRREINEDTYFLTLIKDDKFIPTYAKPIKGLYHLNFFFNWENIRTNVKDTIQLIDGDGEILSHIYDSTQKIKADRRKWLIKNATMPELSQLIEYPNGIIKATAFEGLIRRMPSEQYELLQYALSDTTSFLFYKTGCMLNPMMVGEYLVENVVGISNVPPSPNIVIQHALTEIEVKQLQELYNKRLDKKEIYLRRFYK